MKPFLVQHFLETSCEKFADKIAIKHGTEEISFKDWYEKSNSLGYGLQALGIARGERVGILLDKSTAQVISILGTLNAGLIFVIINPILKLKQIRHILKDCDIKLLIAADRYGEHIETIINDTGVEKIIRQRDLDDMIRACTGKKPPQNGNAEDIAGIIYTSGSTGLPKGIVISHHNLVEGARIVSQYLQITEDERILGLMPFNFDYGLNQLITTLYKGCTIVLFQFFMPNSLLKILSAEKITGLPAIPTIWSAVFNPQMCKIDPEQQYPDLRYISNTGGRLPVPTVKKIRQLFPATRLFLMYGLTEAFRSTYLDPAEVDQRPDSIGKAIPGVRVEVINEKGKICEAGEVGELIHAGACITKGYWNKPELTARVFRPNPMVPQENETFDCVVYSGDLVKKDREGFLYYVGRKDAMIKKQGYRVSPTEIEELLMGHEDVFEAVACGIESETAQNEILALITAGQNIDINDLMNYCRHNAPEYMVPDRIWVRDDFPKTETGKIDRNAVIKEAHAKYNR